MQLRGMHGIPLTTVKKNNNKKHVVFQDKVSVEGEEIELNVVKEKIQLEDDEGKYSFFLWKTMNTLNETK